VANLRETSANKQITGVGIEATRENLPRTMPLRPRLVLCPFEPARPSVRQGILPPRSRLRAYRRPRLIGSQVACTCDQRRRLCDASQLLDRKQRRRRLRAVIACHGVRSSSRYGPAWTDRRTVDITAQDVAPGSNPKEAAQRGRTRAFIVHPDSGPCNAQKRWRVAQLAGRRRYSNRALFRMPDLGAADGRADRSHGGLTARIADRPARLMSVLVRVRRILVITAGTVLSSS
jgi:hypothetical protein